MLRITSNKKTIWIMNTWLDEKNGVYLGEWVQNGVEYIDEVTPELHIKCQIASTAGYTISLSL